MRWLKAWVLVLAFLAAAATGSAQTTTGTITGRVVDDQNLPFPGVTINAAGPAVQGIQTAVTSENGDYIVPLPPPGT